MFRLIIKERAAEMAKEAYEWYEMQKPGLGDAFLDELSHSFKKIELHPTHYGFIEESYRRFALKRFPFIIIYEILIMDVVFMPFFIPAEPRISA